MVLTRVDVTRHVKQCIVNVCSYTRLLSVYAEIRVLAGFDVIWIVNICSLVRRSFASKGSVESDTICHVSKRLMATLNSTKYVKV